jgi:hypothetical protein
MTAIMKRFVIQYNFCCYAGTIWHKNVWKGNVFTDRKCTNGCVWSASGKLTVALHHLQRHNCCYIRRALTYTSGLRIVKCLYASRAACWNITNPSFLTMETECLCGETWILGYDSDKFRSRPYSKPAQPMWGVWWSEWHWTQVFLEVLSVLPCQYRSTTDPSSSSSYQKEDCQTTWKLPWEVSLRHPGFWSGVADTTSLVWCYAMKMSKELSTFREIVVLSSE